MSQSKNPPIQTFRENNLSVKLWEQHSQDGNTFVTASIGKAYKDKEGNYHESHSFSLKDIEKLQTLLAETSKEMEKWHDYYRATGQMKETTERPQPTDMAAKRDAVMREAAG